MKGFTRYSKRETRKPPKITAASATPTTPSSVDIPIHHRTLRSWGPNESVALAILAKPRVRLRSVLR